MQNKTYTLGLRNWVPALIGLGKGGNVTSAGWQVTLCGPIWHVTFRSGEARLRTATCTGVYSTCRLLYFTNRRAKGSQPCLMPPTVWAGRGAGHNYQTAIVIHCRRASVRPRTEPWRHGTINQRLSLTRDGMTDRLRLDCVVRRSMGDQVIEEQATSGQCVAISANWPQSQGRWLPIAKSSLTICASLQRALLVQRTTVFQLPFDML